MKFQNVYYKIAPPVGGEVLHLVFICPKILTGELLYDYYSYK